MNLFAPLFAGDGYLTWKMTILRQGLETHVAEASKLARRWAQGKTAANAQEVLFDVIDQFVAQRWTWMPGLLFRVYQEHGVEFGPEWRITRDDFRDLRDCSSPHSNARTSIWASCSNSVTAWPRDNRRCTRTEFGGREPR